MFADIIAFKGKLFLLPFLIMVGKGRRGAGGEALRKVLRPNLFHVRETPFLKREDTTKGQFSSFVEREGV